ncbi:enhanced intracellular survival protein Eis [Fredinandcohnia humi]
MSIIRKLSVEELDEFVQIDTNAYPGVFNHSPEVQQRLKQQFHTTQESDPRTDYYGLFRDERLLGGMRLHHYTMNFSSTLMEVGGVGSVAVDLLHKKEGVAKELIEYFIAYFRNKNCPLVMLYPFRLDFYKKMGFGYGTKMNQYKIKPSSFPKYLGEKKLQFLTENHTKHILDCYNRYASTQHGMMLRTEIEADSFFKNPNLLYVGYVEEDKVLGYLSFTFKKESETNFSFNDLHVKEFIYENVEAKNQLFSFLHSQFDQINRVVIHTQDEYFHFPLQNPTNGTNHLLPSVYHEIECSGLGLMYRVVDVAGFFKVLKGHNFNNVTSRIKFVIQDSFVNENSGPIMVNFTDGIASVVDNSDYEFVVSIDISDFSSLVMGVVTAKALFQNGLLAISDYRKLGVLNRLFQTEEKPICMTAF